VAAEISRNLIEPKLRESTGPDGRTFRLTNPNIEIDAAGEPEPDQVRLNLIVNSLAAIAKLGALRDEEGLPPFARLDAFRALSVAHRLRPTQIKMLFRFAGPPQILRWTYELVPSLTEREVEAISRVSQLHKVARFVPYDLYEPPDEDEK
jgi:hypothetical protein